MSTFKEQPVEINKHNEKVEIIIKYQGEKIRVLCDNDGIHIGDIKESE